MIRVVRVVDVGVEVEIMMVMSVEVEAHDLVGVVVRVRPRRVGSGRDEEELRVGVVGAAASWSKREHVGSSESDGFQSVPVSKDRILCSNV